MSTRGQFDDLLRDIEPSPTVPALVEGLRDTDQGVRLLAARALEQLEAVAVPAQIPALIVAVGDRDLCVRRVAMRMLGQMGPNASAAVPALISAVQDAYEEVRSAAAR